MINAEAPDEVLANGGQRHRRFALAVPHVDGALLRRAEPWRGVCAELASRIAETSIAMPLPCGVTFAPVRLASDNRPARHFRRRIPETVPAQAAAGGCLPTERRGCGYLARNRMHWSLGGHASSPFSLACFIGRIVIIGEFA